MDEPRANQRQSGDNQRAKGSSVLVTACDQCYRCKVRCSGTREACDRCLQNGSTCTYSLGKPLGKPPKHGRGRAPKNKSQRPKRLRCSTDDVQADGLELPESPSPSSSGSGSGGVRKRRRLDVVQELNPSVRILSQRLLSLLPPPSYSSTSCRGEGSFCQSEATSGLTPCRDIQIRVSTARIGDSPYPISEPLQGFPSETAADTALLGFDMDMPLDLDLGMNFDTSQFGFFMDSPRPHTPALASSSAAVSTPPSSLSSAVQAPSTPAQLWTPTFLRIVSDLYTAPHCTPQRFDRTMLLARQGLDLVISYLPALDSCNTLGSASPSSLLVCVIIVQQVLASYTSLKSQISSRLFSSNVTSSNLRPSFASSTSPPKSTNETAGEAVYIGSFQVEGIESQCHVLNAIVNLEIERFEKVLIRLEEWTVEWSRDGKGEGKLAHQIVVALKARLSATS